MKHTQIKLENEHTNILVLKLITALKIVSKLINRDEVSTWTLDSSYINDNTVPDDIIDEYISNIYRYKNSQKNKENSLFMCIGIVFFEVFTEVQYDITEDLVGKNADEICADDLRYLSFGSSQPHGKREKILGDGILFNSLKEWKLPDSVCWMVSNLLNNRQAIDRYNSMLEIQEDLLSMINDPDRFLSVDKSYDINGVLESLNNRLYDRETALSDLEEACKRSFCGTKRSEIVLISGYSGTGKSSLVRSIEPLVTKSGGFLLSGKYEQLSNSSKPLSAIVTAFKSYCDMVLERDPKFISIIGNSIKKSLEPESKILTDLIPTLETIIGIPAADPVKLGVTEGMNRLEYLFRMLARAISSATSPIVFFLDDLQWADKSSLSLIQYLISDPENHHFIFIGCYRDNMLNKNTVLFDFLKDIKAIRTATITHIELGNLTKPALNRMVSDSLCLPRRLTRSLANTIHRKTSGNPLFVIQLLKSLGEEKMLYFSLPQKRWKWDIEKIDAKNVANNIVDLMTDKILILPHDVQYTLKIASCFGSQVEESNLIFLSSQDEIHISDIVSSLCVAVDEGLLNKLGTTYAFSHDQIETSVHSLIAEDDREAMHLFIGRALRGRISESEFCIEDFIAVDQMNFGSSLISDEKDRRDLARLNLRAGEKSFSLSDFLTASKYFIAGKLLLDESFWETDYDLCIELFTSSAETDFATAHYESMYMTLDYVIEKATSFKDRLRPYYTMVKALSTLGKTEEAINFALNILEQLGESFPSTIDHGVVMEDFRRTQVALDGYSEDNLSKLDKMKDEAKCSAMQFFYAIAFALYVSRMEFLPLVGFRMVQLSLSYGLCKESAFGFSVYGMTLCSFSDYRSGYKFHKVSLKIIERFNAVECMARIYAANSTITTWSEPLELSLEPLLSGHRAGMLCGDIEYATMCIHIHYQHSFHCGKPLEILLEKFDQFNDYSEKTSQEIFNDINSIYRQFILNLMGKCQNPIILSGDAMNLEEMISNSREKKKFSGLSLAHHYSSILAYLFGDYEKAAKMANAASDIFITYRARFEICTYVFYHGLTAALLSRSTGEHKWLRIIEESTKKMKWWVDICKWNCQQKYDLLTAELLFSKGDFRNAKKSFTSAIFFSKKHRFIHDEALSCERTAIFHLETGNADAAKKYYRLSQELYSKWGAKAKSDQLEKQLSLLNILKTE